MSTSIVVRSRTFYAKSKCTISPIQGGKKKCSNVSNPISHKSQKLTDSNRFAVLGVLAEQEIIKLLDKNSTDTRRNGTVGTKEVTGCTVNEVSQKSSPDERHCGLAHEMSDKMLPLTYESTLSSGAKVTSKCVTVYKKCKDNEGYPSRDIFPGVQSDVGSDYCKIKGITIVQNKSPLGDNYDSLNSSDSLTEFDIKKTLDNPICMGQVKRKTSIKTMDAIATEHDYKSDTIEANSVIGLHSDIDLTKSADIITVTRLGKNHIKKVNVPCITDKCQDLDKCLRQQTNALGFLPINNLTYKSTRLSLEPKIIISDNNFDPVAIHRMVRRTGKYNFEEARILLPSKINFKLFEELTEGFWDWQLPYFIKYGFPLDFPYSKEHQLEHDTDNHTSATKFPDHVDTYLTTELEHGAIAGPFTEPPYGKATHVSPFMSRNKIDSDNRRIIIDLSWPLQNSVNYFTPANIYMDTIYKLQYPTVDNITDTLKSLGRDAVLYKIDLSRAFRQLRIDPSDYNLLCLHWNNQYYSDLFCPFGHRSGSMAMTRLTSFFRFLMHKQGYQMFAYVDDMIGCSKKSDADDQCDFLLSLLERLGFPISPKKLVRPTQVCNCLGIMVNTKDKTLFISDEKQQEIINKCKHIQTQTHITKRQLQSIIGSIMFVHKCVKSSRYFTNRLLNALRQATSSNIEVNSDIRRDIAWFQAFMPSFNGLTTYDHVNALFHETIEIDACLQGMGGVWGNRVYTTPIPDALQTQHELSITQYEMLNILIALRVWGHMWRHQRVVFKVDNLAVVTVCGRGYTKCRHLGAMTRNIWLLTAMWDIELEVVHIPGKHNKIADMLSRMDSHKAFEATINHLIRDPIWHQIDPSFFEINYDI